MAPFGWVRSRACSACRLARARAARFERVPADRQHRARAARGPRRRPLDRHHRRRFAALFGRAASRTSLRPTIRPAATVLAIFDDNEQNIWAGMQTGLLRLSQRGDEHLPSAGHRQCGFRHRLRRPRWVAVGGRHAPLPHRCQDATVRNWCLRRRPAFACAASFETAAARFGSGPKGDGVFRTQNGRQVQYTRRTGLVNDFVRAFLRNAATAACGSAPMKASTRWHDGTLTNYLPAQGLAYFSIAHHGRGPRRRCLDRHGARREPLAQRRLRAGRGDRATAPGENLGDPRRSRRRTVVRHSRRGPVPLAQRQTDRIRHGRRVGRRQHLPDSRR